jgi:hypothetical protein
LTNNKYYDVKKNNKKQVSVNFKQFSAKELGMKSAELKFKMGSRFLCFLSRRAKPFERILRLSYSIIQQIFMPPVVAGQRNRIGRPRVLPKPDRACSDPILADPILIASMRF